MTKEKAIHTLEEHMKEVPINSNISDALGLAMIALKEQICCEGCDLHWCRSYCETKEKVTDSMGDLISKQEALNIFAAFANSVKGLAADGLEFEENYQFYHDKLMNTESVRVCFRDD